MIDRTPEITKLIQAAAKKARKETAGTEDELVAASVNWPVECTVGPGLEGAIAGESKVGYVNGSRGKLSYGGYDIFDLCAKSSFEEVCFLLLQGHLPTTVELNAFKSKLTESLFIPEAIRHMSAFHLQEMHAMSALRLGMNLLRRDQTTVDQDKAGKWDANVAISSDEDSIPMETTPRGEQHAIYEFRRPVSRARNLESCCKLISGTAAIVAAIARVRTDRLPLEPDPALGHAANFLYMATGKKPTPEQERVMDVALILHADHGINASTFATLVVASTLSDIYSSVGAGVGALTGPLHGGANEQVLRMLREIGSVENVHKWYARARRENRRIMGVGHRVYKVYDPRARILGPLAKRLAQKDPEMKELFRIAIALEKETVSTLGKKGVFPNVDYYSGMVYKSLGIPEDLFTAVFAVSRVSGWTARILEYLQKNRIFRPRVMYSGPVGLKYKSARFRRTRQKTRKR